MEGRNRESVAAFMILLLGGGAYALYLSAPALLPGGSWQQAAEAALPMLAGTSFLLGIAWVLRSRRVHGRWPFRPGSTRGADAWVLGVFYWLTIAPVIVLTSIGLFEYPFEIAASLIWPSEKPIAVSVMGWVLLVAGAAAGLCVPWLLWKRLRKECTVSAVRCS